MFAGKYFIIHEIISIKQQQQKHKIPKGLAMQTAKNVQGKLFPI